MYHIHAMQYIRLAQNLDASSWNKYHNEQTLVHNNWFAPTTLSLILRYIAQSKTIE